MQLFNLYTFDQFQFNNNYPRMIKTVILIGLIVACLGKSIYDVKKSYVINLSPLNFEDQINKYRHNTNYVSVVHFYQERDGFSADFVPEMDKWAAQFRGVFRIGAIDCDEHYAYCKKEGITTFPSVKIIAPVPIPVVVMTEQLTIEKIQKTAAKYLHSNSIEITSGNLQTFLGENPSVPKVLLFTDRPKGTPMIYKGLSVAFQKKLNFGLVRNTESILTDKYSVSKFPTLMVIKTGQKKPILYKGKQFNFQELFDFLNIYSEVFVPGGGSSLDSSATKQWMTETFPQMHEKSARDICLGTDNTLCVIYLTDSKPSDQVSGIFEALMAKYDRKIERGAQFKFMWINLAIEKKWAEIFKFNGEDKVVVLNPGKRKRYTTHDGQLTKDSISMKLDSITGGDARFNRVSELPQFEIRSQ